MFRLRFIALILPFLSLIFVIPAEASSLYAAYNDNTGQSMLLDVDPLTGNIQSRTGIQRVSASAGVTITEHFNLPLTGLTYGNGGLFASYDDNAGRPMLLGIDPRTGNIQSRTGIQRVSASAGVTITEMFNFPLTGLTYGNGALFASYDDNAGRPMLLDIDPLTGNIQSRTGIQRVSASAGVTITEMFNFPLTGLTYGNGDVFASYDDNSGQPMLLDIDPLTGNIQSRTGIQRVSAIPGGSITEHFPFPLTGLTYGNGTLFASYDDNAGRPMLLDIDPLTGDILSRTGIQRTFPIPGGTFTEPFLSEINGIAFVTAVPLPGSLALFGFGLLLTIAITKSRAMGGTYRKGAGLLERVGA